MSKQIIGLLTFLLILFCQISYAQLKDFQTWNSLSADKEIIDNLTLMLEQEFRIVNNSSALNGWLTEAGLQYKLNKYVRLSGIYRYTYGLDIELGTEFDHRFMFDLGLRKKLDRFTLSYRGRYQIKYADYQNKTIGDTPLQYFRNKFQAKYNVRKSKLTPYTSFEFYYSLNNPMGNEIDKWRATLGASYNFSKTFSANIYYRHQQRRVTYRIPTNVNIIGTGLSYSF